MSVVCVDVMEKWVWMLDVGGDVGVDLGVWVGMLGCGWECYDQQVHAQYSHLHLARICFPR